MSASLTSILRAPCFEVDALCDEASQQTGLTDFGGDDDFRPALEVLLRSLTEEAKLHRMGRFMYSAWVLRLLRNRLFVARDRSVNPSVANRAIDRPVFILGLPRTGTTLLHRVLAGHPECRAPVLWELMQPSAGNLAGEAADFARIEAARETVKRLAALSPSMSTAHTMDPFSPEECMWLLEHTFIDPVHELSAHVPSYSRYLTNHISDPATYRYHSLLLRLLDAQRPARRWVLKAPRHLGSLDALFAVYPDAYVVTTHRSPLEALPSMCSLTRLTRRLYSETVDSAGIGAFWQTRLLSNLSKYHAIRKGLCQSRFIDVRYDDLTRDANGVIRMICDRVGLDSNDAAIEKALGWSRENPAGKRGRHKYSLEEFGLDEGAATKNFEWYIDAYLGSR